MADNFAHSEVGGLSGLSVVLAGQGEQTPINTLMAIGTGVAFAKLPDILEPATNPHHRQFFHSFVVLAAIGFGVKKAYNWKPQDRSGEFWRALALCAGIGYLSHLLLDGFTPRSLPLIGKI